MLSWLLCRLTASADLALSNLVILGLIFSYSAFQKLFIISLLLLSFSPFLVVLSFKPKRQPHLAYERNINNNNNNNIGHLLLKPKWLDIIKKHIKGHKIKVGLVNINDDDYDYYYSGRDTNVEAVHVRFDHVGDDKKWEDFFLEWVDEDHKWGPPSCPEIPMPAQDYRYLDVIVARVPCRGDGDGDGGVRVAHYSECAERKKSKLERAQTNNARSAKVVKEEANSAYSSASGC